MRIRIDNKHSIEVTGRLDLCTPAVQIIKTSNEQPIDLELEPVILFRGRDKLALPMLKHYRQLCIDDGCTQYQMENFNDMIRKFEEFANTSPTMKQPGCTLGK